MGLAAWQRTNVDSDGKNAGLYEMRKMPDCWERSKAVVERSWQRAESQSDPQIKGQQKGLDPTTKLRFGNL